MSGEGVRSSTPWASNFPDTFHNNNDNASTIPTFDFSLRLPPMRSIGDAMRSVGDGLDFRRPVMSQPSQPMQSVIDLTEEPDSPPEAHHRPCTNPTNTSNRANRPPRFPRDIIDLEAESPEDGMTRGVSPDVEVLSYGPSHAAREPQSRHRGVAGHAAMLRPASLLHDGRIARIGNTDGRPPLMRYMRNIVQNATAGHFNRQRATEVLDVEEWHRHGVLPHTGHFMARNLPNTDYSEPGDDAAFVRGSPGYQLPRLLDFDLQGFPMGNDTIPQPPAPTYEAPPPPRAGYTRSPTEDQELVCPNCDEELGVGGDDVKRQVWVVKNCGHVYCGDCTKYRHKGKARQARLGRSNPFSKCVVEGCGKGSLTGVKRLFTVSWAEVA
ncbi:MAG: hypothetical protein Q9187_000098 [Circinaria calcarea]